MTASTHALTCPTRHGGSSRACSCDRSSTVSVTRPQPTASEPCPTCKATLSEDGACWSCDWGPTDVDAWVADHDAPSAEVEALAAVLIDNRSRAHKISAYLFDPEPMAQAILASDWLAAHNAEPRPWRPEDGDGRCQACGKGNAVWFTDNDLWNQVMPNDGILCIPCFISRAEAAGGPAVWRVVRETTAHLGVSPTPNADVAEWLRDERLTMCGHGGDDDQCCSPCLRDRIHASDWLAAYVQAERDEERAQVLFLVEKRIAGAKRAHLRLADDYHMLHDNAGVFDKTLTIVREVRGGAR